MGKETTFMVDIYVATHKKLAYVLPSCYKVMQVNCKKKAEHWEGYLHDDCGDNISEKMKVIVN